jgi:hypothetical protein
VALLLNAMRTAAITGSHAPINDWLAGRQVGRFLITPAKPDTRLRGLQELHARGVIDDAELATLRERLKV